MKNIVITGTNRGIGLSLTKQYQQQGCQVYAVCRKASSELRSTGAHIIEGADVTESASIDLLKDALSGVEIDLLINNAGLLQNEVLGNIDFDSIQAQMNVNAYGPLRVTEALKDNIKEGGKIAMITSRMGSIEDNTSGGRYGYRMSKAALNIAAVSIAQDLKHRGIAVGIFHPGLVGTEMIGGIGDITPDQAANRLCQRIEELNIENTGTFRHSNGEGLPW